MPHGPSRKALALASALLYAAIAGSGIAATLTVNSTSDAVNGSDGLCTLREAIVAANANAASGGAVGECAAGEPAPTVDVIAFAIPGTEVRTIAPASALPPITEAVTIDGYTQAGSSPNAQPTGSSNAVLRVAIDGTNAGSAAALLRFAVGSAGSEVRGLIVNRARATAIHLAAPVRVAGNFIGTDATGVWPEPNALHGLEVAAPGPGLIGGNAPAERNVIAFNGGHGVRVAGTAGQWRIVGNRVLANVGKGIALADGALPLANDLQDADGGANDRQNFPLIDSVTLAVTTVRVQGRIAGAPSRTLLLDFYGTRPPETPAQFLQGESYLGPAPSPIATDAQGRATFDVMLPWTSTANLWVTATLTDITGCFNAACGNTSEFSQRGVFLVAPRQGGAASALPVTVTGHLFQPGASFAFGTTPANGIGFADAQTLNGVLPPLNPGTLYDVTVTNPDTTTATMPKAFVTDFADVAAGSAFHPYVMSIAANGITLGCQAGLFCGGNEVSRASMALFLVRALHGPFFAPPPATGVFADVPLGVFPVDWIEQFYTEGITSGCAANPLRYCPNSAVTRAQMAVFLLRAKHGPGYVPPTCTGLFADVSCSPPAHLFVNWIEQLAREGITSGCAANPLRYCPDAAVLRLQMAVFLTRAFGLSDGVNAAPAVNAGADQAIVLPASANLAGNATDDGRPNPPGTLTYAWSMQSGPGTVTFGNAADMATTASFSTAGAYVLRLTVSDGALSGSDDVLMTVQAEGAPPALNPSPVDPTVTTTVIESTRFLYTGPSPVQTGVAPGTIVAQRAAVVRGKVRTRTGDPLPNVAISVLGHPELGATKSRTDGSFDLAVNGGLRLAIDYRRAGFLPAQRHVDVPWQDYVAAPDVVLIPVDPVVTVVDLTSNAPIQVARGSVVTDGDGTRRATALFPQGLTAQMRLPDGSIQPLSSLSVRATEYTVGSNGPLAMPGVLPPSSMYTYAVELGVDEAVAAGATRVQFDRPIPTYVENFLGFPAGTRVPTGYYDRVKGEWIASRNGRIVAILGATGGLADVDADGDGAPDAAVDLAALGITDAERATLATLYSAGQSLWRVPVTHFTPWDHNWPYAPPADAKSPADSGADVAVQDPMLEGTCIAEGSMIDCQNQALGEAIGITGTPFVLSYWSNRVPGRIRGLDITLSGGAVPPSLRSIGMRVSVAGQTTEQVFPAAANQATAFAWDGRDAYGRHVQGGQVARVSIDYTYPALYMKPRDVEEAFAQFGSTTAFSANRAAATITASTSFTARLGEGLTDARALGLGGWTLDVHHFYDPVARVLHLGDGRRRQAEALGRIIDRIPLARMPIAGSTIAVGPDKSVYYIDVVSDPAVVRRIAPDGTDIDFAGGGKRNPAPPPPYGENGPAIGATLFAPGMVVIGPDGSLYIMESSRVILQVGLDGIIRRVAGQERFANRGTPCPGPTVPEGAIAAETDLCMQSFTVGPDGTIYFVERRSTSSNFVKRIGRDGRITTYAGNGALCPSTGTSACGDGGTALAASFRNQFVNLAVAPDGGLLIADASSVRRVGADGIITTIAGHLRQQGFSGDGGPAAAARFCSIQNLAVAPDGTIYVNDLNNRRLRRITPDGIVATIAGSGPVCSVSSTPSSGDGGPALKAFMQGVLSVAVAPDDDIYLLDSGGGARNLRRVSPTSPGIAAADFLVPSADGGQIYLFSPSGKHLRTLHGLTGAVVLEFGYDAAGRLASVVEKTGGTDNVTTIEHDASGHPLAIVGPYGHRTVLTVDANGFLASVANPANEVHRFVSTPAGLLTAFTDPRGNTSTYAYDVRGKLVNAVDPAGGTQSLGRAAIADGSRVTRTTALGRASMNDEQALAGGIHRSTGTAPDGTATRADVIGDAASVTFTRPDGSILNREGGPDPRLGMVAAFTKSASLRLPSNAQATVTATRQATLAVPSDATSLQTQADTITGPDGTTTIAYAAATGTLSVTSPGGRTSSALLDTKGRVTRLDASGFASSTLAYDARGRLVNVTAGTGPSARAIVLAYGGDGRLATLTDPLGRNTHYTYDTAGRLASSALPDGRVIAFGYDAAGKLTSLTPPGRPAHGFAWDARGELVAVTPPTLAGTGPVLYAVDSDRQLASVTRPGGEKLAFIYDSAGRLTGRNFTRNGVPVATYGVAYDSAGREATLTAPGGISVANGYDGPFRLSETWSGPVAGTRAVTLDALFRAGSESINGGNTVLFTYDADGFLARAGDLVIARDADSGLPTGAAIELLTESWTHDEFGATASYVMRASGVPLYSVAFTRDKLGRSTTRVETIQGAQTRFDFAYDAADRVSGVQRDGVAAEGYQYDASGNRISVTLGGAAVAASFDVHDRILAQGTAQFTYDGAGRTLERSVGGQHTRYGYDAFGNLESVALPDGRTVTYVVDPKGRRIGKRIGGTLVQAFLYGGALRPVAELDTAGAVVTRFVYAGAHVPAYMERGGQKFRFVIDEVGSVRLVVNAQTGAVVQRLDYDSFGRVTADTNPGFQPFGFGGGIADRDTGLVSFGAREYDPTTGRWTTPDPIRFAGGHTNLYAYVGNDPVNRADPTGLFDAEPFLAGVSEALLADVKVVANVASGGAVHAIGTAVETWQLAAGLAGVNFEVDPLVLYRDGLGLKMEIDRGSVEYWAGIACGAAMTGGVSGIGRGAAKAATRGGQRAAASAAQGVGKSATRRGLSTISAREAEVGIKANREAADAAADAAAAQARRAAQETPKVEVVKTGAKGTKETGWGGGDVGY